MSILKANDSRHGVVSFYTKKTWTELAKKDMPNPFMIKNNIRTTRLIKQKLQKTQIYKSLLNKTKRNVTLIVTAINRSVINEKVLLNFDNK